MVSKFLFWNDRNQSVKKYIPISRTRIVFRQIWFLVLVLKTPFWLYPMSVAIRINKLGLSCAKLSLSLGYVSQL
jgi:hypothetical protein